MSIVQLLRPRSNLNVPVPMSVLVPEIPVILIRGRTSAWYGHVLVGIIMIYPSQYILRTEKFYTNKTNIALSVKEQQIYNQLSVPKRKREWLLGRFAAKELVINSLCTDDKQITFSQIQILNELEGRPFAQLTNKTLPNCLSISHCDFVAFCSLEQSGQYWLGVDLEKITTRPKLFVETFYTTLERDHYLQLDPNLHTSWVTAVWSLKEATLKALGKGLSIDTKNIEVTLTSIPEKDWMSAQVHIASYHPPIYAWVRKMGSYVFAWVALPKNA